MEILRFSYDASAKVGLLLFGRTPPRCIAMLVSVFYYSGCCNTTYQDLVATVWFGSVTVRAWNGLSCSVHDVYGSAEEYMPPDLFTALTSGTVHLSSAVPRTAVPGVLAPLSVCERRAPAQLGLGVYARTHDPDVHCQGCGQESPYRGTNRKIGEMTLTGSRDRFWWPILEPSEWPCEVIVLPLCKGDLQ